MKSKEKLIYAGLLTVLAILSYIDISDKFAENPNEKIVFYVIVILGYLFIALMEDN